MYDKDWIEAVNQQAIRDVVLRTLDHQVLRQALSSPNEVGDWSYWGRYVAPLYMLFEEFEANSRLSENLTDPIDQGREHPDAPITPISVVASSRSTGEPGRTPIPRFRTITPAGPRCNSLAQ
jgi:hypothetical protein